MNEITTIEKKPANKYPVLVAIFIVLMFFVGYLFAGFLNYGTASSEINQLQRQVEILQNKNSNVEFQNKLTVLAVHLSDNEIKILRAKWVKMKSIYDYKQIDKVIADYYKKYKLDE